MKLRKKKSKKTIFFYLKSFEKIEFEMYKNEQFSIGYFLKKKLLVLKNCSTYK